MNEEIALIRADEAPLVGDSEAEPRGFWEAP